MANSTAKSRAAAKKPPIVEVAAARGGRTRSGNVSGGSRGGPQGLSADAVLDQRQGILGKERRPAGVDINVGPLVLIVANVGFSNRPFGVKRFQTIHHHSVDVGFSNRPFGVKRFQTIHHHSVDVAHGLVLLFGIGTKALPVWDSKTRRNNLSGGLL